MAYYSRNMPDTATYWAPVGNDGFGGTGYDAPVTMPCRWQGTNELFRDAMGNEVTSSAVVYLPRGVSNGGALMLGESAATTPPSEAREIRRVNRTHNLNGTIQLVKVML